MSFKPLNCIVYATKLGMMECHAKRLGSYCQGQGHSAGPNPQNFFKWKQKLKNCRLPCPATRSKPAGSSDLKFGCIRFNGSQDIFQTKVWHTDNLIPIYPMGWGYKNTSICVSFTVDLCTLVFVIPVPINCCHCNVLGALVIIVQAQYK